MRTPVFKTGALPILPALQYVKFYILNHKSNFTIEILFFVFDFDVICVNFSAYIMSENLEQNIQQSSETPNEEGVITMKQLLEAGVHFGHQSSQWNPAMKEYIYGARNGIHIIDLQKTLKSFIKAYDFIRDVVSNGKEILFVGTKKQAQAVIGEEALRCDMPFVNSRWLGGTLTNFNTIRSRVEYLIQLKKLKDDGEMDNLPKKEQITLGREMEKLEYLLNGILNMKKMPGALFVVDTRKEDIAIKEARKIGIPIVGIVDTNSNPADADYVIPSNDDAIRAVKLCVEKIANAYEEGKHSFMQRVQSGEITKDKDENESSYVVERKAFVFKSNTQENDQESIVYGDDKKPDSEE